MQSQHNYDARIAEGGMMHEIDMQRLMNRDFELARKREWERASRRIWREKWAPRLGFVAGILLMIPVLFWMFR